MAYLDDVLSSWKIAKLVRENVIYMYLIDGTKIKACKQKSVWYVKFCEF